MPSIILCHSFMHDLTRWHLIQNKNDEGHRNLHNLLLVSSWISLASAWLKFAQDDSLWVKGYYLVDISLSYLVLHGESRTDCGEFSESHWKRFSHISCHDSVPAFAYFSSSLQSLSSITHLRTEQMQEQCDSVGKLSEEQPWEMRAVKRTHGVYEQCLF